MPVDLLLPAFVIVLTANAILIGIAIRSVRAESRSERAIVVRSPGRGQRPTTGVADGRGDTTGRTRSTGSRSVDPSLQRHGPASNLIDPVAVDRTPRRQPRAVQGASSLPGPADRVPAGAVVRAAATDRSSPTVTAPDARRQVGAAPPATRLDPDASGPAPAAPKAPRTRRALPAVSATTPARATSPAADAASSATATSGKTSGAGRRRRFSLPPLDEDQEKVNRSIRSFLAGGPAGATGGARASGDQNAAPSGESGNGRPPTTVAYVAIDCPDARRGATNQQAQPAAGPDVAAAQGTSQASSSSTADDEALVTARATVEQALRSAARGTDRVERINPDRFRVVLAATGELAARAYLRRTRAAVEPVLDALQPPRRLAAATATALGEPVPHAIETAERRLEALLEAGRSDDLDMEPRAAGR
jgi:hypothetical protein